MVPNSGLAQRGAPRDGGVACGRIRHRRRPACRGGVGQWRGCEGVEHVGCGPVLCLRRRGLGASRRSVACGHACLPSLGCGRRQMAGPRHAACGRLGRHDERGQSRVEGLVERGWSLESAAKHATMRVAMGTDVLSSVAMARAARAMWHRLLSEMGCPNAGALRLEAQTSTLGLHAEGGRDALLSNTVAAYAAVVGGVDGLEVRPHDFRSHDGLEPKARNTPGRCVGPETSNTCCGKRPGWAPMPTP